MRRHGIDEETSNDGSERHRPTPPARLYTPYTPIPPDTSGYTIDPGCPICTGANACSEPL